MFEAAVNFASPTIIRYRLRTSARWRRIRTSDQMIVRATPKHASAWPTVFALLLRPNSQWIEALASIDPPSTRVAAGFPHALLSGPFLFGRASFLFFVVTLTE